MRRLRLDVSARIRQVFRGPDLHEDREVSRRRARVLDQRAQDQPGSGISIETGQGYEPRTASGDALRGEDVLRCVPDYHGVHIELSTYGQPTRLPLNQLLRVSLR